MQEATERARLIAVGLNLVSMGFNLATAVRSIDKANKAIIEFNQMREASIALSRIANYQNALINKHLDVSVIDDFDRLVFDDMVKELKDRQEEIRKTQAVNKPRGFRRTKKPEGDEG